jgi:nicotinamidase-related amidase
MTSSTALIVVDVQEGIANLNDGVPDAEKIIPAIDSILRLARTHNEMAITTSKSKDKIVEILFVQHDDKDPEDPLYRGKPTWNLVFPPRQGATNERLISKKVGVYQSWIY